MCKRFYMYYTHLYAPSSCEENKQILCVCCAIPNLGTSSSDQRWVLCSPKVSPGVNSHRCRKHIGFPNKMTYKCGFSTSIFAIFVAGCVCLFQSGSSLNGGPQKQKEHVPLFIKKPVGLPPIWEDSGALELKITYPPVIKRRNGKYPIDDYAIFRMSISRGCPIPMFDYWWVKKTLSLCEHHGNSLTTNNHVYNRL